MKLFSGLSRTTRAIPWRQLRARSSRSYAQSSYNSHTGSSRRYYLTMAGVGVISASVASMAMAFLPSRDEQITTEEVPERSLAKYADKPSMLKVCYRCRYFAQITRTKDYLGCEKDPRISGRRTSKLGRQRYRNPWVFRMVNIELQRETGCHCHSTVYGGCLKNCQNLH